jgi:hypothetical protein
MIQTRRKLLPDQAEALAEVKIATLESCSLLYAPIYVYLEKNGKYLSVKGPFDFFTDADLDKLKSYKVFYVPKFVYSLNEIRQTAVQIRTILVSKASTILRLRQNVNFQVKLLRAPFEISNIILKNLGQLWRKYPDDEIGMEPFFMVVFVNELLGNLPPEVLLRTKEADKDHFEKSMFISSIVVFLALHLGYCDFEFISSLRLDILDQILFSNSDFKTHIEVQEMISLAEDLLKGSQLQCIKANRFDPLGSKVSQKLFHRLGRIREELLLHSEEPLTVFGERGLINA